MNPHEMADRIAAEVGSEDVASFGFDGWVDRDLRDGFLRDAERWAGELSLDLQVSEARHRDGSDLLGTATGKAVDLQTFARMVGDRLDEARVVRGPGFGWFVPCYMLADLFWVVAARRPGWLVVFIALVTVLVWVLSIATASMTSWRPAESVGGSR